MTAPLLPNEQLREEIRNISLKSQRWDTLGSFLTNTELSTLVDFVADYSTKAYRRGEEHGYPIGWNDCVSDCPDKMSTEPLSEEETE